MMAVQKQFIGWNQPILWSAVQWLSERFLKGTHLDLEQATVVVPSSLAGRRLLEYLVLLAEEKDWQFSPPLMVTMGALPELLYTAKRPLAGDLVQALVWTEVLMQAPATDFADWLFQIPDRQRLDEWMDLANLLAGMHRELASDDLDFAGVGKILREKQIASKQEELRWNALAKLQRAYWDRLDELELWDAQTARRIALQKNELQSSNQIILIGNVDLNRIQKNLLEYLGKQVTVLVGAPESWHRGFDNTGCLLAEAWHAIEIPIEDSQLHVAGAPADQAERVAELLSEIQQEFSPKDITIGLPDASLLPFLEFQFQQNDLNVRYGPGSSVNQAAPFKLLSALTAFLQDESYANWASLLRQPPMEVYLRKQLSLEPNWLVSIDRYYHETLIRDVPSRKSPTTSEYYTSCRQLAIDVAEKINELLKPLRGEKRHPQIWVEAMLEFFQKILADFQIEEDDKTAHQWMESCRLINDLICSAASIPPKITIQFSCAEWLRWLLRQIGAAQVSAKQDPAAVEMIGWLELMLDDSPALLLTGMSLTAVPDSVQGDSFLPNQLRSELGLLNNERRWARDAYSLMVATQTRERLEIVVGRMGTAGEPVLPSRLLFATKANQIGQRVLHLLQPTVRDDSKRLPQRWKAASDDTLFPIPQIVTPNIPEAFSVTDFKSYLSCPYRYYLDRILRLDPLDDSHRELNARRFGTLIHDCLDRMGKDKVSTSTDSAVIFSFLSNELDLLVAERFGIEKTAALEIQVAQARQRLKAFADQQAIRAKEGWIILHTEYEVKVGSVVLEIEGEAPLLLKGRIDRVDYNPETKVMAIWDYKTSDTFNEPLKAHYDEKNQVWKDLQLPLYRHMVGRVEGCESIQLGYITLPRKLSDTQFRVAAFKEESLKSADEKAKEIVGLIRAGQFGPPVFPAPFPEDPYEAICQNNILRRGPFRPIQQS
jgi:RecB family exonuclease